MCILNWGAQITSISQSICVADWPISGDTMSWLLMVGLTMDSFAFSLPQLAKILEHVMPPAGPLTFWSSFTSFHGLWQVPARQGEDCADLLGGSSI